MYRTLLGIVATLALALLLVGLTFSASAEEQAEFRFINGTEPGGLDPHQITGVPEGRIAEAIFEGLTRRDAKTMKAAPGVAERWDISEDRRTYTFHIRRNARWSDGKPVTAKDFVYSWLRILNPDFGSEYAYILHVVRYAEAYNTYSGHADALTGPVSKALSGLITKYSNGVDAKVWQLFLSQHDVHGPLKSSSDEKLRRLLGQATGSVTRSELDQFGRSLVREASRLRQEYAEAKRRFGVDGGVFAEGDDRLIVELRAPTPYFLEITSFYSALPVPRWLVETKGNERDWFLPDKIVSNGPYLLKSWRVNDRIRLVKNPTYWDKDRVRSRTIDALPIENATTGLNLYLTGEVDWLPNYPPELVDKLKRRPDFESGPGMIVYYYRFNCTRRPFNDARVRHAVSLAVNRKVIVDEVLRLGQLPAHHFVPPGMPGYDQPESKISYDVPLARKLLAEAGYPDGKGFPKVGILYNTLEAHKQIAEVVADQLRRNLGINITAYNQEWQSYLATVRALDYDIARAAWIGDYHDPNTFLDMWITNGGNNQTGFSSPKYDLLLKAAADLAPFLAAPEGLLGSVREPQRIRSSLDSVKTVVDAQQRGDALAKLRLQLLAEAEAILVQDEFPIMPIYFYVVSNLVRPEVRGFYAKLELDDGSVVPNIQDIHPLSAIWVDRSETSATMRRAR